MLKTHPCRRAISAPQSEYWDVLLMTQCITGRDQKTQGGRHDCHGPFQGNLYGGPIHWGRLCTGTKESLISRICNCLCNRVQPCRFYRASVQRLRRRPSSLNRVITERLSCETATLRSSQPQGSSCGHASVFAQPHLLACTICSACCQRCIRRAHRRNGGAFFTSNPQARRRFWNHTQSPSRFSYGVQLMFSAYIAYNS